MFHQTSIKKIVYGRGENLLLQLDASVPQPELAVHAGSAKLVYFDPPFMTGSHFTRKRPFGEEGWAKGKPVITLKSYSDCHHDHESYERLLRGLIENAFLLLTDDGLICLHLDWHASHIGRTLCDEIFGAEHFVNEIIWTYNSGGRAVNHFSYKHDTIIIYSKGDAYDFHLERVPLSRTESRHNHMKRSTDEDGRSYRSVKVGGKEYRYYDDEPAYPSDVWTDISHLQQRDPERTGFITQKPLKLLDRLLRPFVDPGDLVVDLCCGSGTTLEAAAALGCRFIGCDINDDAIEVCLSRLSSGNLSAGISTLEDDTPLNAALTSPSCLELYGLPVQDDAFPPYTDPLDPVERWTVGHIMNDTLFAEYTCQRTHTSSALLTLGPVTPQAAPLGIVLTDAAGHSRVYEWTDDTCPASPSEVQGESTECKP